MAVTVNIQVCDFIHTYIQIQFLSMMYRRMLTEHQTGQAKEMGSNFAETGKHFSDFIFSCTNCFLNCSL